MLVELNIKNYTLIESLAIEFDKGLNVLTGETGAGKSIIVGALGCLLGERASSSIVRKGSPSCRIAARFNLEKNKEAAAFLNALSLWSPEDESLALRREIDAEGKSKSYVNDRPVNLSTLSRLGELLVEIHGQNEHQRLLKTAEQRDFLDRFAGAEPLRGEIAALYEEWRGFLEERDSSRISEQEKNRKIDLYQFQVKEIDAAALREGEEEEIDGLLPALKNAEKIRNFLDELFFNLYEDEGSAVERLKKCQKALKSAADLGADMKEAPSLLEESAVKAGELVHQIESLRDKIVSDPAKLDDLISRQDLIAKLKKKYGASVEEILQYRDGTET